MTETYGAIFHDAVTLPLELRLDARAKNVCDELKVRHRPKSLDLIVAIDAKAKGRRLAWTVGYEMGIEVRIAEMKSCGLITREGDTNLQVELATSVHGEGLVFVGFNEVSHGLAHVLRRNRRKACAINIVFLGHLGLAILHDFECNVLSFAVTIEPKYEGITASSDLAEMITNVLLGIRFIANGWGVKESARVYAPAKGGWEVQIVDVTEHTRHKEGGFLSSENTVPFVDWCAFTS